MRCVVGAFIEVPCNYVIFKFQFQFQFQCTGISNNVFTSCIKVSETFNERFICSESAEDEHLAPRGGGGTRGVRGGGRGGRSAGRPGG